MLFFPLGENEEHDANFVSDEVQIKVEDNIDPIGDVDDQFFDDDYNSHSAEIVEKTEEEEANLLDNDEEEDDSAFCITPHSQKKSKRRPTLKITKAKPWYESWTYFLIIKGHYLYVNTWTWTMC